MEILKELNSKVEKVKSMGWIPSIYNGSRSVGRTFEKSLGLCENDFEIPDYKGIVEIKTKSIRDDDLRYKYINLFCATPDSYLYEIKRIVKTYGYPYYYDRKLRVFNRSFYANKKIVTGGYVYKLEVDRIRQQVVLKIYNAYNGFLVDDDVAWSFDLLKEKLMRKLQYLLYVKAKRKYEFRQVFFKYVESNFYMLRDFECFLKAIEDGYVRVTFKIGVYPKGPKYGDINDHGTSFDIDEDYLERIFERIIL